jgi:hypothetical protein
MQTIKLNHFNKPQFLKRIGRDLLTQFFERAKPQEEEQSPHCAFALPPPGLADADYYYALAGLLLQPGRLAPNLIEDLSAIEEMATREGLARLERVPEWARLQTGFRPGSSAEEIAMQIWLAAPQVLAREHNLARLRRLTAFEHAAPPWPKTGGVLPAKTETRPNVAGASFAPPDKLSIANLSMALDAWFARNQRGEESTQIEIYSMEGDHWFMIRHGDLFNRVSTVDRQHRAILHFRPERDDAVVHSARLRELRVNARTQGERDLYIEQFGLHLHGSANYFSERRPYTLEPLRATGQDALSAEGLEGIRNIRLCRVSIRLNNHHNEILTREADDLFRCQPISPLQRGPFPDEGLLERALFEIQFTGTLKPQPVEIRVPNVLKLGRRCDTGAVQNWLCQRGFRRRGDIIQKPVYSVQ